MVLGQKPGCGRYIREMYWESKRGLTVSISIQAIEDSTTMQSSVGKWLIEGRR
jgi:hypothetical protein